MMIHFFFEVAIENFTQETAAPARVMGDCKAYLTIWLSCIILNYFVNNGMLFCRFIYARYATGLITNGKKLFHILVCCGTGAFLFQWLGIQPFQYHFGGGNFPMNLWKGYVCTKTTYTESLVFGDVYTNIDYLIKPKLIIITCSLLFLLANLYFTKSAFKMTKRHGIPKRNINLIDMKTQNLHAAGMLINFIIDQVMIFFLQVNYETLGEQNTFMIWWSFHLWEIIQVHVLANILIIYKIWQREEFNGYNAKVFPGQDKPRQMVIQPRRKLAELNLEARPEISEPSADRLIFVERPDGSKRTIFMQLPWEPNPDKSRTIVPIDIN